MPTMRTQRDTLTEHIGPRCRSPPFVSKSQGSQLQSAAQAGCTQGLPLLLDVIVPAVFHCVSGHPLRSSSPQQDFAQVAVLLASLGGR